MRSLLAYPAPALGEGDATIPGPESPASLAIVVERRPYSVDVPVGFVSRGSGLWRNARLYLHVPDGVVTVDGMPAVMAALASWSDAPPFVVLPLHPGYHAVYGPDGTPSHRIMLTSEGEWSVRRFQPHASDLHPTFKEALVAVAKAIAA